MDYALSHHCPNRHVVPYDGSVSEQANGDLGGGSVDRPLPVRTPGSLGIPVTLGCYRDSGISVRVWESCISSVRASVMVGKGDSTVLLAGHTAGSQYEHEAVTWAIERIAAGAPGFYVLLV